MILHGLLIDEHAAEEHEGEHEKPEGGDCEVGEKHLHAHIVKRPETYLEVHGGHKEGDRVTHVPNTYDTVGKK
jgi:hypothetical protein